MDNVQRIGIVGVAVALLGGSACATSHAPVSSARPTSDRNTETNVTSRWHVAFASPGATAGPAPMEGWASMRSGSSRRSTSILLNVTRADPGTVLPWELHHGRCGADQGSMAPRRPTSR